MPRIEGMSREELDGLLALVGDLITSIGEAIRKAVAGLFGSRAPSAEALGVVRTRWVAAVDAEILPALAGVYDTSAQATAKGLAGAGRDVEGLAAPDAADFLAAARNRLVGVGDERWEAARTVLADGVRSGQDMTVLAERVAESAQVSEARAMVIARTEVLSAMNHATLAQARVLDDPAVIKEWLSTADDRTRPEHRAADGQRVRIGEPFKVGGAKLDYPGDPTGPPELVIACRCGLAIDLDDEPVTAAADRYVRDRKGKFAEHGDALKLLGKIDLAPGETLAGSGKVDGRDGTVRMAVVDSPNGRTIRLGIGGPGFGGRDDEAGPWRAGPDTTVAENERRNALSSERDALESVEYLSPEQQRRLDELDNTDTGEVFPSGYTTVVDQRGVEQLDAVLTDALAAGGKAQAEFDAHWDELARLEDQREPLRQIVERQWTDQEESRWDEITAQIEALEAQDAPHGDYEVFAEGSIAGRWADVHYRVEYDDPGAVGVQVILGAVPPGHDLDDLTGNEQAATLNPVEAKQFLRMLANATKTKAPPSGSDGGLVPVTSAVGQPDAGFHLKGVHDQKSHAGVSPGGLADILDDITFDGVDGQTVYTGIREDGTVDLRIGTGGDDPVARFTRHDVTAISDEAHRLWRLRDTEVQERNEESGIIDDAIVDTDGQRIYLAISRKEIYEPDPDDPGDDGYGPVLTVGIPTDEDSDEVPDFHEVDLGDDGFDDLFANLERFRDDYEPDEVDGGILNDDVAISLMADHTVRFTVGDEDDDPLSMPVEDAAGLIEGLTYLRGVELPTDPPDEPVEVDAYSPSDAVTVGRWSDGRYVLTADTVGEVAAEVEFTEAEADGLDDLLRYVVDKDTEARGAASPTTAAGAGERSHMVQPTEVHGDWCRNPLHPGPCAKPGSRRYKQRQGGGAGTPAPKRRGRADVTDAVADLRAGRQVTITPRQVPEMMEALADGEQVNMSNLQVSAPPAINRKCCWTKHLRDFPRDEMPQLPTSVVDLSSLVERLVSQGVTASAASKGGGFGEPTEPPPNPDEPYLWFDGKWWLVATDTGDDVPDVLEFPEPSSGDEPLTAAAAEAHTGAMVALVASAADIERLAVDGGEPATELHCTLLYLGEAADIPAEVQAAVLDAARDIAEVWPVVEADGFAVNLFNPGEGDPEPCAVLGLSGEDLAVVHELVADAVEDVADEYDDTPEDDLDGFGWEPPENHMPWHAHLTLRYFPSGTDPAALALAVAGLVDKVGPVTFDRLRVAYAGQVHDFPLAAREMQPDVDGDFVAGPDDCGCDFAGRMPLQLRKYWIRRLRLGSKGSFRRCVKAIRKHFPRGAEGTCANLYKTATGRWPGSKKGHAVAGDEETTMTTTAGSTLVDATPADTDLAGKAMPDDKTPDEAMPDGDCPEGQHRDDKSGDCVPDEEGADYAALVDCTDGDFCRNPLHPGPCKGSKRGGGSAKSTDTPRAATKPDTKSTAKPEGPPKGPLSQATLRKLTDERIEQGIKMQGTTSPKGKQLVYERERRKVERSASADTAPATFDTADLAADEPAIDVEALAAQDGEHFRTSVKEGVSTGFRSFAANSIEWREPPFAFHEQIDSSAHGGTARTVQRGIVTRAERDGDTVHFYGRLDLRSPDTVDYARRLAEGFAVWSSVGPDESVRGKAIEFVWPDQADSPADAADMLMGEPDEMIFHSYTVAEISAVSVPALADARVEATPALLDELAALGVLTAAAVPGHKTATADGDWDGAATEKRLPTPLPVATARKVYAWVDASAVDGGEVPRSAVKFPHHDVDGDGKPGPANLAACTAVLAAVHGARSTPDIPEADRRAVYDHARKHLVDSGRPEQTIPDFQTAPLVAAGYTITIPECPPAAWFAEPADDELPPYGAIRMDENGRLIGLLAPADVNHRSFPGKRVKVPMGNVDYTGWMNKAWRVAEGHTIKVGVITMNCGHASVNPSDWSYKHRREHYDNSCSVGAHACVYEKPGIGVALAGVIAPWLDAEDVGRLLSCDLSGDWPPHPDKPGWLDFIAALAVPAGGFANRAKARAQEGLLVAAAVPVRFEAAPACPVDDPGCDLDLRPVLERIAVGIGRDTRSRMGGLRERVHSGTGV